MALGSNNPFPKVIFVEMTAGSISTPPAGQQKVYVDSADHHQKRKDSSGVVFDQDAFLAVLAADPASPIDNTAWIRYTAGTPSALELRVRISGTTHTLASSSF